LLLIASSIGVNIARYPQVGRTAEPAPASAAETASPPQTAGEVPRAEKQETDRTPVKPETPASTVREPSPSTANLEPIPNRVVAVDAIPIPAQSTKDVPIIDVRPMVSVGDTPANGAETSAYSSRIQRLPPVENSGLVPLDSGGVGERSNYPTTTTP
jgi:hypothetical protein